MPTKTKSLREFVVLNPNSSKVTLCYDILCTSLFSASIATESLAIHVGVDFVQRRGNSSTERLVFH